MSMRHSATHGASIAGGQTVGVGLLVRLRSHTRWIIVSTIAALVLVATPAFAGVPASEPSGCNTVATNGWYYSCWVSNNSADPDRISDFSTAIQTVLSYNWQSNDNPSGIDGYFGTNSYNGTKQFQTNHSISSDGIVGQTTWNYLQQDLDYTRQSNSGGYAYLPVENSSGFYFRERTTTGVWDVWRLKGGSWGWVRIDRWRS